jgi:hypothetical protein
MKRYAMKKSIQILRRTVSNIFRCSRNKICIRKHEESVTAICYFLEVDLPSDGSKKIFVKISKGDVFDSEGRKEVKFYQTLQEENLSLSVPHCYFAGFDDQVNQPIIILDDYSDTHQFLTDWPIPPEIEHCKKAISVLAKLHAKFWNYSEIGISLGCIRTPGEMENDTAEALDCLNEFVTFLGDRISKETAYVYEKAISNYYLLVTNRVIKKKDITLCHQDAHLWNFLFSKNGYENAIIIDWGSWEPGIGVDDLAYMIGLHWHPLRRKQFELNLIEFYHSELVANGVHNYSFSTCYEDYRVAILGNLFIPLWQWKNGVPAQYWWPHFERAPLAYSDLYCDDLIS